MDTPRRPTTQPGALQVRGDFVLLRADGLRLLLPRHDVYETEYLEHAPAPTGEPGLFAYEGAGGAVQQVVALSAQMRMLPAYPPGRFVLTRLGGEGQEPALAWTEMRVMIDTAFELQPLPAILRGASGLVDAYTELDGEIAFCTTAERVLVEARKAPV